MERGEIWHVDLDPVVGREQGRARYVLVISPRKFNNYGTPVVVPISSGGGFAREHGFSVSLTGAGTNATGVILCHQVRAIDLKGRGGRFREKAPDLIVDEVLARVNSLFEAQ
jgi:mRNA-degrading endonuclease toxin of MazEF toxin-antitoxin module